MKANDVLDQKGLEKILDPFYSTFESNCIPPVLICEVIDSQIKKYVEYYNDGLFC
jgi:hypothetical protein